MKHIKKYVDQYVDTGSLIGIPAHIAEVLKESLPNHRRGNATDTKNTRRPQQPPANMAVASVVVDESEDSDDAMFRDERPQHLAQAEDEEITSSPQAPIDGEDAPTASSTTPQSKKARQSKEKASKSSKTQSSAPAQVENQEGPDITQKISQSGPDNTASKSKNSPPSSPLFYGSPSPSPSSERPATQSEKVKLEQASVPTEIASSQHNEAPARSPSLGASDSQDEIPPTA